MADVNNSYITYGENYPITLQIVPESPNFAINGDSIKIVVDGGNSNNTSYVTIRNSRGGIFKSTLDNGNNRYKGLFADQQSGVIGYIWNTVADGAPIDDYIIEFTIVIEYNGNFIKFINSSIRKSIIYNSLLVSTDQ